MKYAVFGFFVFIVFTFFVSHNLFKASDLQATIKLQQIIPGSLTTPFSLFSILGSFEFAGLILLFILFLSPKLNKISVLFLFGISSMIELFGKSIISQKAPPIEFLKTDLHIFLPVSSIPKEFFSYPSGHSGRTAFISGILLFAVWKSSMRKELKIIFAFLVLIFDLLMFVSRVYLGEHWGTDVVGGLLLGYSFALLYPFLASRFKKVRV